MELVFDEAGLEGIAGECDLVNRRVTKLVADDARRLCPVDSGDLLRSIDEDFPAPLTGNVIVGTQYWDMNEYGGVLGDHTEGPYPPTVRYTDQHSHMNAQPFMRPAVYQVRAL